MKDVKGNKLREGENLCSKCGVGCLHHNDKEAKNCLRVNFSGRINIDDWANQ